MRQMLRALSTLLVLLVIALVSAAITMRLAIHGTEVRVPALSGLSLAKAAATLRADGLETAIDGHFYSTTEAVGHVMAQRPAPGTLVRKSWPVRVAVSLGPQKAAIPALEGMDQNIATLTIRRIGLQVGDIATLPEADASENAVLAQSPLAGATNVQSPAIALLSAQAVPPPQQASVMPDLTGETFSTAALSVLRAGFKLAPLENPPDATPTSPAAGQPATGPTQAASPGTVIAQQPVPGSRIVAGSTVQLSVQP